MERRFAAILVADMAGYSRLMEKDEAGVLQRHKMHRRELIDPGIARSGGRIIKTTGDGMLAEFPSAQDAVRCAIDVQTRWTAESFIASGSISVTWFSTKGTFSATA